MNNRNTSDLTGFASLLGDSFYSKINLLTQILKDAHYPSLGKYKENLLANVIRDYIPTNYQVGTGFVLFVHEATSERASKPGFDHRNMGSHSVSKQCDLLIYDASKFPVIFKDDDFVILRPESVKAVIEVKGSANKKEIDKILNSFYDFGKKWQECQLFYREHNQPLVRCPTLYAMCWEISKDAKGRLRTNGTRIREQVANFHKENFDSVQLKIFPILDKLFIYNECEISYTNWTDEKEIRDGWMTTPGKFTRYDDDGNPYRKGDSTIANLLAGLHYAVSDEFNRFYSHVRETMKYNAMPYEHQGFSTWHTEAELLRDVNTDFGEEKE